MSQPPRTQRDDPAEGPGHPTESGHIQRFLQPKAFGDELRERFRFYDWNPATREVRWMTAFDTAEQDVDNFVEAITAKLNICARTPARPARCGLFAVMRTVAETEPTSSRCPSATRQIRARIAACSGVSRRQRSEERAA